jgi:uncharacterized protein (DUF488 family)
VERPRSIWTVGHSNHDLEVLAGLLLQHRIEFVVDVRSYPYSGFAPHFDREPLASALASHGVRYLFLGEQLGGRPTDEAHYDDDGHALYSLMAEQPGFLDGIERVQRGAASHRLALMCSCGKPDECHRRLLVGKVLADRGTELRHLLPDGTLAVEHAVRLGPAVVQSSLFGEEEPPWRSTRSVSHRRRLSGSSAG